MAAAARWASSTGVLAFLAACGSSGGSLNPVGSSVSTPGPTSTLVPVTIVTATPTPVPTPSGFSVGDTVDTTTGAKITVQQVVPASSTNEFETPPPGGRFRAAKVRECAGSSAIFTASEAWSMKLEDDTQVDGTSIAGANPNPELPTSNLQPGNCVAGWVYFALPPSPPAPVRIQLSNTDFFWTLPPGT